MGFLSPALLALAAGVAVPLLLHLLHRSQGRRISFPALRYLLRTERDHARRIRARQLLLLVLRSAVIVLAALAAGRMVIRGSGPAHPPTAVAVILDNSLSSGRVVGSGRVLDSLKAAALAAVDAAGPGDRFWILRAGEPWDLATPLGPVQARERIRATAVTGGGGDLSATLTRAARLLDDAELATREIHLLSDLQATAFADKAPALDGLPVLVLAPGDDPEPNRFIRDVALGGGLAPRANRRTDAAVTVGSGAGDDDPATAEAGSGEGIPVRLFLEEQLRGASAAPPQGTAVLPVGPFSPGRLEGWAETDPDALRADDRFYLSVQVEPPPGVSVQGDAGPFLQEALEVLDEGGRIRLLPPGAPEAQVRILPSAQGMETLSPGQRAVVLPGADAALRPALNRRLKEAGVPVEVQSGPGGEVTAASQRTGLELGDVPVQRVRTLAVVPGAGVEVWAALSDGSPWLVSAGGTAGEVVVLASRLDPEETGLPLDASMIPLVEWMVSGSRGAGAPQRLEAGTPLSLPVRATAVEDPSGTRFPVDGTHEFRFTGDPGIYTVLDGEEVLDRVAVNAPLRESLLAPVDRDELEQLLASGDLRWVSSAERWGDRVFVERRGREVWPLLLGLALLLLLVESAVAASGGILRRPEGSRELAGAPTP